MEPHALVSARPKTHTARMKLVLKKKSTHTHTHNNLIYVLCDSARLFGFVARKQGSTTDNVSHLFAELDPDQPASAITGFVSKVMKR